MTMSPVHRGLARLRTLPRMVRRLASWGAPPHSLVFGPLSLGDDLLCTAVLHEARRRGRPMTMFSNRPELFLHNPDPQAVHPIDDHYLALLRRLGRPAVAPYYVGRDPIEPDRDVFPPHHIIVEMCRLAGISGEITIRPRFFLTDQERGQAPRLPRQIVVQTSAASAAIPFANKEWGARRFAALGELLSADFDLVQVGSVKDPVLPGATIDLRGKTSLRETAATLANARLFVGPEGFLTHLARAVDCPSVVLLGGRATPAQVGYVANTHLCHPTPCTPCGRRNTCPHDLGCMREITPADAADAIRERAAQPRGPLPVAKHQLAPG